MVHTLAFLFLACTSFAADLNPTGVRDLLLRALNSHSAPHSPHVEAWVQARLLPEFKVLQSSPNLSQRELADLRSFVDPVRLRTYGSIARVSQDDLWVGLLGTKNEFQVILARLDWKSLLPESTNPTALYTPDEVFLSTSSVFEGVSIRSWAARIRRGATDPGRAPEITSKEGSHYRLVGYRLHGLPLLIIEAQPTSLPVSQSNIPSMAWGFILGGLLLIGLSAAAFLKRRPSRTIKKTPPTPVTVRPSFEYLRNIQSAPQHTVAASTQAIPRLSDPDFEKELLTLSQSSSERALFAHLARITSLKFQTPTLFLSFHPGPAAALLHTHAGFENQALPSGGFSVLLSERAIESIVENAADGNLSELSDYEPLKKAVLEHFGVAVFNAWAITPLLSLASFETDSLIAGILVMIHPNVETVAHQRQLIRLIRTASLTYGKLQGRYRNTNPRTIEREHTAE